MVDFEDEEYKELKFVRVYQIYKGITSVLEIELNAAKMYFRRDWYEDDHMGDLMMKLLNKRCCYRKVFANRSKVSIEQSLGHLDEMRENFDYKLSEYKVWL